MKKAPLDCMTWKQAAAPMVVSAVASATVMSMRAGGRRGAAEFLDDGGGHGILAMKLSTMGAKVPVGAPMTRSATPPKLRMVAMSRVFPPPPRARARGGARRPRLAAAGRRPGGLYSFAGRSARAGRPGPGGRRSALARGVVAASATAVRPRPRTRLRCWRGVGFGAVPLSALLVMGLAPRPPGLRPVSRAQRPACPLAPRPPGVRRRPGYGPPQPVDVWACAGAARAGLARAGHA